jgi:aliphatic nitrilase
MGLIIKRKRMMDSVGHYARPELLSLNHDTRPAVPRHEIAQFPLTETGSLANVADNT